MTTLYGIRNCDTCRKALKRLQAGGLAVVFHDVRRDGVSAERLQDWLQVVGAETLVNRRSATWRKLTEAEQARADASPLALLQEQPTLIRRPLLEHGEQVIVGFREEDYAALLRGDAS